MFYKYNQHNVWGGGGLQDHRGLKFVNGINSQYAMPEAYTVVKSAAAIWVDEWMSVYRSDVRWR